MPQLISLVLITGATSVIIWLGIREKWFQYRPGVVGLMVAMYIMILAAYPPPVAPPYQIMQTVFVLAAAALAAFIPSANLPTSIHVREPQHAKQQPATEETPEVIWVANLPTDPGDALHADSMRTN